jgi:NAD(P)H-hydrate epimerase
VPLVGETEADVAGAGVVVDALLGFGARGPPRPPLDSLIDALRPSARPPPIVAVDIPSGWGVDDAVPGGPDDPAPTVLVSLTAPKPCASRFAGAHHYVGGRFVPPALAAKYGLDLPTYPADGAQVVRVGGNGGGGGAAAAPAPGEVAAMRADYGDPTSSPLPDPAASADPWPVFEAWFGAAVAARVAEEPNAMCLATADPATGAPSARYVLMKGWDAARGISFYTNLESRKARELLGEGRDGASSPRPAALVFYWEGLKRSVRVEGSVSPVPPDEADAYFASRPRGSQVGAHASRQSRVLAGGRADLEAGVAAAAAKFAADPGAPVPRPASWGGFIVCPSSFEFWAGASSRLHDRVVFDRQEGGEGWRAPVRLAP